LVVSCYHCCIICKLEPMDRIKETVGSIMRREAELFVSLLLNELNKCIETRVEKKRAEVIPLKDDLV